MTVSDAARARFACKHFVAGKAVPADVLEGILNVTAQAPSSFNVQPWTCVLVDDPAAKERLARAMLAANGDRVLEAPVVAVFAADLRSSRRIPATVDLLLKAGLPENAAKSLPLFITIFSSGYAVFAGLLRWPMFFVKRIMLLFAGIFAAVPKVSTPETWAFKNTMPAVAHMMLAAAEVGVATLPMEGFDERRVRNAVGIPRSFGVPCVVALGYATPEAAARPRTGRFPLKELFNCNAFGASYVAVNKKSE